MYEMIIFEALEEFRTGPNLIGRFDWPNPVIFTHEYILFWF